MTVCDDPTDPTHMTPDERLDEVAAIFAEGVRRLRRQAVIIEHVGPPEIPPDSARDCLAGGQTTRPYGQRG